MMPEKPLVGKEGQFLFDYGTRAGLEFRLLAGGRGRGGCRLVAAGNGIGPVPIVRTAWNADGVEVLSEAFQVIPAEPGKPNTAAASQPGIAGAAPVRHRYAVLLSLKNLGSGNPHRCPVVRIAGACRSVSAKTGPPWPSAARPICSPRRRSRLASNRARAGSSGCPTEVPAGQTRQVAFTIVRHGNGPYRAFTAAEATDERVTPPSAGRSRRSALGCDLRCPTRASKEYCGLGVRNIWQAEIKDGQPAFHVGPTCYRGLWVVPDGSSPLERTGGRAEDARAWVSTTSSASNNLTAECWSSARWMGFHKETGIVLWMCYRHAVITQDKPWLESIWPGSKRWLLRSASAG